MYRKCLTLFILCYCSLVHGQEYPRAEVKAELTMGLIKQVFWPDEAELEQLDIAFFGTEADYFSYLTRSAQQTRINNLPVRLVKVETIANLSAFQVLIVAQNTALSFSQIALQARQTNTLVISETSNDQIYIMINIVETADETLSFELNRANMILEGLSTSSEILLLGGTELDIAELYREMERSLSQLAEEIEALKRQSSQVQDAYGASQYQLEQSVQKLLESQSTVRQLDDSMVNQRATIIHQEEEIASRKTALQQVAGSARQQQQRLASQALILYEQTVLITAQGEEVEQNELLLGEHEQQLASQILTLNEQSSIIRDQMQALYLTLLVLLLFLLLLVRLYILSRERKLISVQLTQRSLQLEQRSLQLEQRSLQLEQEVKYGRQHNKALSDLSPVGVYQTDAVGNCRYVNDRWCEYSGLSVDQAMGAGWLAAIHPDDGQQRLSKTTFGLLVKTCNSEHRYLKANGEIRWMLGRCEPELDIDGTIQGYIGTVTDITEQKYMHEQLRRTQKMDSLGMLTGGIAHDYNNMLAVVIGFSDLLKNHLFDQPKPLAWVEQIVQAGSRGQTLTKKLLSFSKQSEMDASKASINEVITFQQQMIEKTLTPRICLELDLARDLWRTWLDVGDLGDALVNISINAMHAISGGGKLKISTENLRISQTVDEKTGLACGDYVLVRITDNGAGMSEDTRDKLFDPFFSTKGSHGTGLGLTQVYSFMQRSQGAIDVSSRIDEGTTFSLYFPRYSSSVDVVHTQELHSDIRRHGSETILIVDDEIALLDLAREILSNAGYHVVCASSGRQALELLQQAAVDLLLSDIVMPEMDGYKLSSIVQAEYPEVTIQLVSGFADEAVQNGNDIPSQNIIRKPYQADILLERISLLLDQDYALRQKLELVN
ncbi:MAG: DUF4154 domain-containing protein [Pseudomonadales bacterium]|nr:DUF4154 domain-containing protein [Pseudomonadales bacterium]